MVKIKPIVFARKQEQELERWLLTQVSSENVASYLKTTRRTIIRWRQRIKNGEHISDICTLADVNRLIELRQTLMSKDEINRALISMGYAVTKANVQQLRRSVEALVKADDLRPKGDANVTSKGDTDVTSEGDTDVTSKGDTNVTSKSDANVTSKGDTDVTSEGDTDVTSKGDADVTSKIDIDSLGNADLTEKDSDVKNTLLAEKLAFGIVKLIKINNDKTQRGVSMMRVASPQQLGYKNLVKAMAERQVKVLTTSDDYAMLLKQAIQNQATMISIQGKMVH